MLKLRKLCKKIYRKQDLWFGVTNFIEKKGFGRFEKEMFLLRYRCQNWTLVSVIHYRKDSWCSISYTLGACLWCFWDLKGFWGWSESLEPLGDLRAIRGLWAPQDLKSGVLNLAKRSSRCSRILLVDPANIKSPIAKVFTDFCQSDEKTSKAASLYSDLSQSGSLCFLQTSPSPTTPLLYAT